MATATQEQTKTPQTQQAENGAVERRSNQQNYRFAAPRVNIWESQDHVTLEAEMPGVSKDDVQIEVKDNELTINGKRDGAQPEGAMRLRERMDVNYYRSFTLGRAIDLSKIDAQMRDGVLRVTLHKAEHVKPRVINIQ